MTGPSAPRAIPVGETGRSSRRTRRAAPTPFNGNHRFDASPRGADGTEGAGVSATLREGRRGFIKKNPRDQGAGRKLGRTG